MAGRGTRTISEYSGERNEERSEISIKEKQLSNNEMNTEGTIKTSTVETSLIKNNDNRRDKHSSISSFIKTASHIIAPATSFERSAAVKRISRRDDSEQNYYDDLALNNSTIGLFGGHKGRKSPLVIKCLSIQLFSFYSFK